MAKDVQETKDVPERPHAPRGEAVVRPATRLDYVGMKRVWRAAYDENIHGGERTYDRYLDWAFARNPHAYPENVPQWVAELDGNIVGAWCATPVRLSVRGTVIPAFWTQNLAMAPEARGLGIARKMFSAMRRQHRLTLGVGCTASSRPLVESEGVHFVRADRFGVLPLSPRKVARSIARDLYHRELGHAAATLRSVLRRASLALRAHDAGISIVDLPRFGPEVDAFLANVARAIPVMTVRSARTLNWTLENPRLDCVAFAARRDDRLVGYAIVRQDGMLLELLVHPYDPQAFRALLAHVVRWARRRRCTELSTILPGLPELAVMYRAAGFLPLDDVDFALFYAFPDIERTDETLADPRNWFLSLADSDLWSFGS